MDRRALTRLRLAFLLLGAALLLPLGLLLRSVDARLEAQRRLRHELVAERIFDEMERELTGLLQRENTRPSAAYADSGTRVENWAPFVVGYFTRDADKPRIIAKSQLAPERLQRLEAALNISEPLVPPTSDSAAEGAPSRARSTSHDKPKAARPAASALRDMAEEEAPAIGAGAPVQPAEVSAPAPAAAASGQADEAPRAPKDEKRRIQSDKAAFSTPRAEDVLKQLNRADQAREQERKGAAPAKRKAQLPTRNDTDPLGGF